MKIRSQLRVETLAIGDELLTGRTVDSNSHFVGGRLFREGMRLTRTTVILDDRRTIRECLEEAAGRCEALIVFGGLGPTSDDLTVDTVCEWVGSRAVIHPEAEARMRDVYASRNRPITPEALRQVRYPEGAEVLPNAEGLAPGFLVQRGDCRIFFLPGVPREMQDIFDRWVLPRLARVRGDNRFHWHTWRCIGIPESELQGALNSVEAELGDSLWLGYRTFFPENHVTLYSKISGDEFDAARAKVEAAIGKWAYSEGDQSLEERVGWLLREKGWKVALAESCTGGKVAARLTSIPHSSTCVWGSAVVYSPEAKRTLASVEVSEPLEAVSADVTRRLAEQMLEKSGADWAAAVTGYLGPTGGTENDPVGTVYWAVRGKNGVLREAKNQLPPRSREDSQWGAASLVLNAIRECIE